ncbi:MAG: Sapep family Mn(2+)-dependent dipeptidase [Clostridia bacterium]|nr:Sapep family Mn(2+)-dependent dipeptidase [Clostridia bacterium]
MTAAWKEKAEAWMKAHEEEYLGELAELVAIRSVSEPDAEKPFGEGCRRVLQKALDLGESHGLTPANFDGKIGLLRVPNGEVRSVGLWGHLDVVPEGDGWVRDPFRMTREGSVLYGRGVSDNKGPALAAVYALRCIRDLGIALPFEPRVYFGTDEEKGMKDVMWFRDTHQVPDYNLIPDSSFPVCYAEKGILEVTLVSEEALSGLFLDAAGGLVTNMVPEKASALIRENAVTLAKIGALSAPFSIERSPEGIRITSMGKAMHAAHPQSGVNAIRLLTDMLVSTGLAAGRDGEIFSFLSGVNRDCDGTFFGIAAEDEVSGKLTCVGSVLRMREGKPALTLNIRYPVTSKGEEILAAISGKCREEGFRAELLRDSKPAFVPKESPFVETLTGICRELLGGDQEPFAMAGGTYARKLPNAVAFGPGALPAPEDLPAMGVAHEHDEGVYYPNLLKAAVVYVLALIGLGEKMKEGKL